MSSLHGGHASDSMAASSAVAATRPGDSSGAPPADSSPPPARIMAGGPSFDPTLIEARGSRRLTHVAHQLDISPPHLSEIERGVRLPTGEELAALEELYGGRVTYRLVPCVDRTRSRRR